MSGLLPDKEIDHPEGRPSLYSTLPSSPETRPRVPPPGMARFAAHGGRCPSQPRLVSTAAQAGWLRGQRSRACDVHAALPRALMAGPPSLPPLHRGRSWEGEGEICGGTHKPASFHARRWPLLLSGAALKHLLLGNTGETEKRVCLLRWRGRRARWTCCRLETWWLGVGVRG
jgi:hypothetical protein